MRTMILASWLSVLSLSACGGGSNSGDACSSDSTCGAGELCLSVGESANGVDGGLVLPYPMMCAAPCGSDADCAFLDGPASGLLSGDSEVTGQCMPCVGDGCRGVESYCAAVTFGDSL